MGKIKTISEAALSTRELNEEKKEIVLVGGCFDLLHPGHIAFLQKAKEQGDFLIVLVESDMSVTKRKGNDRPVQRQQQRVQSLSQLPFVDLVIPLEQLTSNADYDKLVLSIKPAIIATTAGDPGRHHKERQARLINATVIDVIKRLPDYSTTQQIASHEIE